MVMLMVEIKEGREVSKNIAIDKEERKKFCDPKYTPFSISRWA
jgi:hypothetical protein